MKDFLELLAYSIATVLSLTSPASVYSVPLSSACAPASTYDFIIVGAGSTGSVIASRLSEDPDVSVLLIDAGDKPPPVSETPFRTNDVFLTDFVHYDNTAPQKNCCLAFPGQRASLPSGRGLGGTSIINSMIFTRGNRRDYDHWAALGNIGWAYKDVLPYFRKLESYTVLPRREDEIYHGQDGPITISTPAFTSPLATAFLDAGQELGFYQVDCNSVFQTGFTTPPVNIKNGSRCSTYSAYLEPAIQRSNLDILTNAVVTKVLMEGKTAKGVEIQKKNEVATCQVKANKEVIVSAGALKSPQILMLSGIGPKQHLQDLGIPITEHLPGVGQNLKDHLVIYGIQFTLDEPVSMNKTRYMTPENIALWDKTHTGPLTSSNGVEGIAFLKSKNSTDGDLPMFEISMFSHQGLFPPTLAPEYRNSIIVEPGKDVVTFLPILLHPKSTGQIKLTSDYPHDPLMIDPKYLSHPQDVANALEGLKHVLSVGRTHAFRKYGAKLVKFHNIPGCENLSQETDEFWNCFLLRFSIAGYHFVGSCKMAPPSDPMRVVDPRLRVYGVHNLRVADASIMPSPPSGHTNAASIMIGEKAADMIQQDWRREI